MFNLSDKRGKRRKIIVGYADIDIQLGVLLAAVDFEWTCRRAILALSKNPTVTIRRKFNDEYRSFKGIEKGWAAEVANSKGIASVFEGKTVSWDWVENAMKVRNAIVHGSGDKTDTKEGRYAVYVLETACDIVNDYVMDQGVNLFKPINRRRSKKAIDAEKKQDMKRKDFRDMVMNSALKLGENHWVNISTPWKTDYNRHGKNSG